MASLTNGRESEQTSGDSEGQGSECGVLQFMGSQSIWHDLVMKQQKS